MLTEQQRLIIADMVNNEILRLENGIKDDSIPQGSNAKTAKNESLMDASVADEKCEPSQSGISIGNGKTN